MNNILIIPFILFGVLNAQSSTINVQQKIPKAKIIDNLEKSGKGKSIDKLQKKYLSNDNNENIDESSSEINPSNLDVIEIDGIKYIKDGLRYIPVINDKIVLEKLSNDEEAINLKSIETNITDDLDFYGYNIFTGDPNSFQSSTFGAVDPNYNIGPGDQIIVMLWGESQFRQEFTIDREGYVFLPEVGQVFVNGLNLMALEKKFFQLLSKVYSTLKPLNGKPTTFMDISLGNLRPLRIIVLGEVNQPGAYSVNPSTSLSSSLYYFNGPTTSGSLRNIRLIRGGKFLGSIDFYDYLLSGNTPDDQRLQLDDVVFIPLRGKTVKIFGEITRQGIYELKENEGLENLIQIAGNMKATAYLKRAQIKRIIPPEKRSQMGMDRKIIDINLDNKFHDYKFIYLEDGDEIEIFSIEDVNKNFVEIIGSSVTRPGKYQLLPGMRVMDLLDNGIL